MTRRPRLATLVCRRCHAVPVTDGADAFAILAFAGSRVLCWCSAACARADGLWPWTSVPDGARQ